MSRILRNSFAFAVGFWLIILPFEVFAADLLVTDAGTAAVNGCYLEDGGGVGIWMNPDNDYVLYYVGTQCRSAEAVGLGSLYFKTAVVGDCDLSSDYLGVWTLSDGELPLPTVAETDCSAPPPPPPSGGDGSATSTVSQSQQNVFNGFIIFFVVMFGIMWMFKKRI